MLSYFCFVYSYPACIQFAYFLYNNHIDYSPPIMSSQHQKIKQLSTHIFKPLSLQQCPQHCTHHYSLQSICLKQQCKSYLRLYCHACPHPQPHLHNLNRIPALLSKLLQQKWQQIRQQNTQIENQWRTCQINIKYCIDILNQVHQIIVESKRNRLNQLPVFQDVLDHVLQMCGGRGIGGVNGSGNVGVEDVIRNVSVLNNKYGIFQILKNDRNKKNNILDSDCIDKDIEFRRQKWTKLGQKTKKFSQSALAFSQTLAQSLQNKLKYQKRKQHLQQMSANRIANLKQLLKQYENAKKYNNDQSLSSKMQQLSSLKIQLPSNSGISSSSSYKSQSQSDDDMGMSQINYLQQNLQKLQNLSSIFINNKNGKISIKMWEIIITKFEYLKKLKQLNLNIRLEDVIKLTQLFKQKPNAVRHIPILHLTLADQPKMDMRLVAQFCNTLQLRQLYLTLTRNNIVRKNYFEFVQVLRFKTSLSNLPMNVFELNLTKNRIVQSEDVSQCERKFMGHYKEIKSKWIKL